MEEKNRPMTKINSQHDSQDDIYVMPQKFNPQKTKVATGRVLLAVVALLLLALIVVAGYFLYNSWQERKTVSTPEVTSSKTTNNSTVVNQTDLLIATSTLSGVDATSTTEEIATTTESEFPTPGSNTAITLIAAADADNDGLTDIEESVIGTSATKFDSDGDGFGDKKELDDGYSPVKSGDAKLVDDIFIKKFYTDFTEDNFMIMSINDWAVNSIVSIKQVRITASTGEVIKISVSDNREGVSPLNLYLQNNPMASIADLESLDANGLTGLISADGLKAYLTNQSRSKFYIIEYLPEGETDLFRYPNIFRMIVNSLEPGAKPVQINPTVPSTTTNSAL